MMGAVPPRASVLILRHRPPSRLGDDVERSPERTARAATRIATERATNRLRVSAVLNGEAGHDRRVARVRVGLRVGLVIAQKQFGD